MTAPALAADARRQVETRVACTRLTEALLKTFLQGLTTSSPERGGALEVELDALTSRRGGSTRSIFSSFLIAALHL